MCGFYVHGFWEKETDEIMFDFEINSHTAIKEKRQLTGTLVSIGVDPINGKAVSNSGEELPQHIKDNTELFFQAYFPNRAALIKWIRTNYAKYNDAQEWNYKLLQLPKKQNLFSTKRYQVEAERYQAEAERCQAEAEWWQAVAKQCQASAKRWQAEVERCQAVAKRYQAVAKQWQAEAKRCQAEAERCQAVAKRYQASAKQCQAVAKRCQAEAERCQAEAQIAPTRGRFDDMEMYDINQEYLEAVIELFNEHPNDYWADKNEPSEERIEDFVRIESNVELLEKS